MFSHVRSLMSLSSGNADSVSNDELEFRGIGELAFFAVAFLAWEWAVPGEANLTALSPQPFWIPVILLSAKYGTTSGLIAAGLAVALSIATGLNSIGTEVMF